MLDDIVFNRRGGHYFACLAGTPNVSCSLTPFDSLDERFVWFRFDRRGLSLTDGFLMFLDILSVDQVPRPLGA
jgi:hypothetical protein